jgi:hypothetical protein
VEFVERIVKTQDVKDGSLIYHSPLNIIGPNTWTAVHDSNYGVNPENGKPLRQQTFPEAIRLANFALANRTEITQPVIESINGAGKVLTGNTLVLWTPQGMYGVDHPSTELIAQLNDDNQRILIKVQRGLDKRLSGAIGDTVKVSQDKYVRFTEYDNITYGVQARDVFAENAGLAVLAGNKETAKALAEASKTYRINPGFWGLGEQTKLTVRVPVLSSSGFGSRLGIVGNKSAAYYYGCSFRVFDSDVATRAK